MKMHACIWMPHINIAPFRSYTLKLSVISNVAIFMGRGSTSYNLPCCEFCCSVIAGEELGLKGYTPPYLAPSTNGPLVLRGVNYASGGGGILNHTGEIFVGFCQNLNSF